MVKLGDKVGECPSCEGDVQYSGIGSSEGQEATCAKCGEIFEVEFDEEEEKPAPPPPPPPPPTPAPAPAPAPRAPAPAPAPAPAKKPAQKPPAVPNHNPAVGSLKPVQTLDDGASLDPDGIHTFGDDPDIADYLKKSRPWRWAHKFGRVGNPYRENTRNHSIFDLYVEEPRTIEDCVYETARRGHAQKISFVLVVYEVTHHCLVSGLLVIDTETRKIGPCASDPVPSKTV